MSSTRPGDIFAAFIIIGTVLVGGGLIFVVPRMEEIRDIDARIEYLEDVTIPIADVTAVEENNIDVTTTIEERLTEVVRRNEEVADASIVYDRIFAKTRKQGLQVRQINPSEPAGTGMGMTMTTFNIAIAGPFDEVRQFPDILIEIDGFFRVRSVVITPDEIQGAPMVKGDFQVDFLQYELPPLVAAMVESNAGDTP